MSLLTCAHTVQGFGSTQAAPPAGSQAPSGAFPCVPLPREMATEEISLRPLSLRPGGPGKPFNAFASFGKGAGLGLKSATAVTKDVKKKKAPGEVLRYTRDYLMKFAEAYTRVPPELAHSGLEVLLGADDPEREAQRALLAKVAAAGGDDADERDWRARQPSQQAATAQHDQVPRAAQQERRGEEALGALGGGELPRIQRAVEAGKTAWSAGVATEGSEQAMRKVKGILNKLTPEKFDRLLSQLIPLITSFDILQGTITQVFENAVQQPTFVAMYADLCHELDQALPEFPAPGGEGDNGRVSFKKLLANTCQVEYEATEEARQAVPGGEREEMERRFKQRLLGNIRLISELFKKGMVNDRIMLLILQDLLGATPEFEPSEENVEAVCELLTTAGAALERGERSRVRLDQAFAKLARLAGNTRTYPSRIRFLMRDAIDLRAQHWVARREVFTAKKLDEIRSEAQAELGILPDDLALGGAAPLVGMPGLPPLSSAGIGPGARHGQEELELFPAFRSSNAGWEAARSNRPANGKYSALLGEYVPLEPAAGEEVEKEAASNATPPQAPGQAPGRPRADLTPEQRESLGRSLFSDYLASPNLGEAEVAARELGAPGDEFMPKLVQVGLERAFEATAAKEQAAVVDVLVELAKRGVLSAADLSSGTAPLLEALEDVSLDTPSAPRLLGRLLGECAALDLLAFGTVAEAAAAVESAEPRRGFVVASLLAIKERGGEEKLKEVCANADLHAATLLASDPEFDGDLPDVPALLEQHGLKGVVPL